jgi:hypothetical protein
MNKIRSHLYMFKKVTHCCFKSSLSTAESNTWIFFIFQTSKIHVSPTDIFSSLSPPSCCLSSSRRRHATSTCHASFPRSQDDLAASASSRRLSSRVKIETLNPHYRHRPPSLDHPTPTLHCYKKIISILVILPITQHYRNKGNFHWR